MKSYYIYFIRHGLTDAALEGRYIGHTDVPLCEEGRMQLMQLKDSCKYPKVQAVFSSPLKRCTQTAQILYPKSNTIIIQDLIEYNFGEFENLTADDLKSHPVFPAWLAGEKDAPFGESNEEFSVRIFNAMSKIIEGMMTAGVTCSAVITHGGIIMALLSAFGIPEASMHEWMTPNGCGYTVRITPSIWMRSHKFEVIGETPENPSEIYSDEEDKIYWEDV